MSDCVAIDRARPISLAYVLLCRPAGGGARGRAGVRPRRGGDGDHGLDRQREPSDRGGEDGLEKARAQAGRAGVGAVPVREEGEGGGTGGGRRRAGKRTGAGAP